ncbi:MAG: hypothetical protein JNL01_09100 [Bdellovibrionales bacterium]|nr:hypothetical protein [Bdellovibrionales bacterium]
MITKIQKNETQNNPNATAADGTVEVLYQKLGDRWFAFSVVNDEVFVGSLTPEEIEGATQKSPTDIVGNS